MGKRGPKPGTGGRPKQSLDVKLDNKTALMRGGKPELNTLCLVGNKTATSLYDSTVEWLQGLGCYEDVPNHLIEEYALCKARWLECELELQRDGLTAEHPTTKKPIKSFYTEISMNYLKQADTAYNAIVEIIRLNSISQLSAAAAYFDPMEKILTGRNRKINERTG